MIKIYDATTTSFNNNGDKILKPLSSQIYKEDNGDYYLDLETSIDDIEWIVQGNIVRTNSPWGEQSFRLGNPEIKKNVITVRGKHLYFDTAKYVVKYVKIENSTALNALNMILAGTDQKTPFSASSDIETLCSMEIKQKSLEEAIAMVVEVYGGHLQRDNFSISLKQNVGVDRGVTIAYGKNLTDFKATENWDNVITKILPVGNDDVMLPEVYLSADVQYDIPYTKTVSFSPSDGVDTKDENAVIVDLRTQAQKYLDANKYPLVNYSVNAHIENVVDIGDTIGVIHKKSKTNLLTSVISVKYDCILNKFKSIEFGNFKNNLKSLIKSISNQIDTVKKESDSNYSALDSALLEAKSTIMNYLTKGHKYITENAIYFLDTPDPSTAKQFMIISLGGIGFGANGIDNGYTTAWTLDGKFVADFITAGTLSSILLKSNNYVANSQGMKINLADGTIDSKRFKVATDGSVTSTNLTATNANFSGKITSSDIEGTNITGSNIVGTNITGGLITSSNFLSTYNNNGDALTLKMGSWDELGLRARVDTSDGGYRDTIYGYAGHYSTGSITGGMKSARYNYNGIELYNSVTGKTVNINTDTGLISSVKINPLMKTITLPDGYEYTSTTYANTIVDARINGTELVLDQDVRCSFSGKAISTSPNAACSWMGNVAVVSSSSERYKENISKVVDPSLDVKKLYDLDLYQYNYKDGYLSTEDQRYGKTFIGFIAEKLNEIYPLAVDRNDNGDIEVWNSNIMIPAMFGLIKDLHQRVSELEKNQSEMQSTKDDIAFLKQEILELKAKVS